MVVINYDRIFTVVTGARHSYGGVHQDIDPFCHIFNFLQSSIHF